MTTLGERVGGDKRVIGGPFGSNLTQADYTSEGIPVIRGSNMEYAGRWIGGKFAFVSPQKAKTSLSTNMAGVGNIIVTQRGTLGQVSIIPEDTGYSKFIISQSQMAISVDPRIADRDFVYYYLKSPFFAEYLQKVTIQVGVPHINLGILRRTPIDWPELEAQAEIASAISRFDDKIELNRRISEALDGMAQAIFQDWFVDFGPVRRKAEGVSDPFAILGGLILDSALAIDIAARFPNALGDDGLPRGWPLGTLDNMLNLAYGKSLPKAARTGGKVPVYGSGGIGGSHDTALVKGPGIVVGRKGTVGSLFWEPDDFFAIDTVFYVEPKEDYPLNFLWQLLGTLGLETMNTDAAVPGLNRNNAYRLGVVRPPQPVLAAFDDLVGLLRQRLDAANSENRTLAETRDYLLPRLISGEVRVAHADRSVC